MKCPHTKFQLSGSKSTVCLGSWTLYRSISVFFMHYVRWSFQSIFVLTRQGSICFVLILYCCAKIHYNKKAFHIQVHLLIRVPYGVLRGCSVLWRSNVRFVRAAMLPRKQQLTVSRLSRTPTFTLISFRRNQKQILVLWTPQLVLCYFRKW